MSRLSRSNRKIITVSIIVGTLLVISAIWITALTMNKKNETIQPSNSESQKIERTVSGENSDKDRQDALAQATSILNESLNSDEKFEERMTKLDKEDLSVVSEDLKKKMRFKDIFEETKSLQANTYQSLITISTLVSQSNQGASIRPLSDNAWTAVYVDSEAGVAFVPLSIYSSSNAGFSLNLIYDDGEWRLSPYSLIDSVKLSSNIQSSILESQEK